MKRVLALLIAISFGPQAFAGQSDPRFEGIWVGTETLQAPAMWIQKGEVPVQKRTVLAIGDFCRSVAVVEGLYPGRYAVSPKWLPSYRGNSGGNTLVYAMADRPNKPYFRDACKLIISADGSTITETGEAFLEVPGGMRGGALNPKEIYGQLVHIRGTFHRQK